MGAWPVAGNRISGESIWRRQADAAHQILKTRIGAERIDTGIVLQGQHLKSAVAIAPLQLLKRAVVFAEVGISSCHAPLRWSCLGWEIRVGQSLLKLLQLLPVHCFRPARAISQLL